MPGQTQWEEICVVQRCAVQAGGKAMAKIVIQERGHWLNLANLSDGEKEAILDEPAVAEGIFGSALTMIQMRCKEKRRDNEALEYCMPRKMQTAPLHHLGRSSHKLHPPTPN